MHRNVRSRWIWIVAAIVAAGVLARADESLRIVPIVRDNKVLVSFELADAYTEPVRDAIASGLRTTFTYELELRTIVPSWLDRTIVTATVAASDQFDNLTRRHTLSRTVDGRVEEVLVTEDATVAKTWLTTWNRLPLCDTSKLDPSRDYYVRVSARTRNLSGSLLAWAKSITGQAKFTFVP
jgi:multidrug efflux pump subunit AcrA (membrane-fusion protein)